MIRLSFCWFLWIVWMCRYSDTVEKRWLPNMEWESGLNWANGRVPEIDSRVVFPLEMRHAVGIGKSGDLRLAEIDLPKEGSLVLPRDGKLEISGQRFLSPERKWIKEGVFFWADPENWESISDAAPHLEKVPCQTDDVVLPETNRTFSMLLPIREIQVRSVRTADSDLPMTSWQWEKMRYRRELVNGRFSVKYSLYTCSDCPCQEGSQTGYIEEVCAIQKPRCQFPACEYPLKVEGDCCYYCGGRVLLSKKSSLAMLQTITSETLEEQKDKLSWYVRHTWEGDVEILVKEKGDYSEIITDQAVKSLKKKLEGEGFEVQYAETAGAPMKNSRLTSALGPFLGTSLAMFSVLFLAFWFYGYSYSEVLGGCADIWYSVKESVHFENGKSGKRFGFARFENIAEANVEIAGQTAAVITEEAPEEAGESSVDGTFENPLYRSKRNKPKVLQHKTLQAEEPLALSTLSNRLSNEVEEVELDIEQ